MQQFRRDAPKYLVPDGKLYRRRKINEPPAKVLVSTEQKRNAMQAAHQRSGHCGRKGKIRKVVEQYWLPEMYVGVKDWVKMCEQYEKRAPLRDNEPVNCLTVSHLW